MSDEEKLAVLHRSAILILWEFAELLGLPKDSYKDRVACPYTVIRMKRGNRR